MPLHVPSCLANDPDVRRMAEKVIMIIINPIMIIIITMIMMAEKVIII